MSVVELHNFRIDTSLFDRMCSDGPVMMTSPSASSRRQRILHVCLQRRALGRSAAIAIMALSIRHRASTVVRRLAIRSVNVMSRAASNISSAMKLGQRKDVRFHSVSLPFVSKDGAAAGRPAGFNIVQDIADHPGMRQINMEFIGGLDQQTGIGFSTIAAHVE